MAETNSKGERLISVVRVLEYHGPQRWIEATLRASRIAPQGETVAVGNKPLPEGCSIKSGLVVWMIDEVVEEPPARPLIPIPPGSTSIQ